MTVATIRKLRSTGSLNLVAISMQGSVSGITRPINHPDLEQFVLSRAGIDNLYWMPNEPLTDSPDSKLTKGYVESIHFVWLDIDAKDGRDLDACKAVLDRLALKPTLTIFSGGGYQAFWQLAEPLPASDSNVKAFEALGRGIAKRYDGDNVQNVDRIMRLPGTLNVLSETKVKRGRKPVMSELIEIDPECTYQPKELLELGELIYETESKAGSAYEQIDLTKLDLEGAKDKLRVLIREDRQLSDILTGKRNHPSGSEYDFDLVSRLHHAHKIDDVEFLAACVMVNPHGSDNAKADARQVSRVVHRALERSVDNATTLKNGTSIIQPLQDMPLVEPEFFNPFDDADMVPQFPMDALPESLQKIVSNFARKVGASNGAAAFNVLAAIGAAIHKDTSVAIDDDWRVHANLFLLNIGNPSVRKTPMVKAALSPFDDIDRQYAREAARQRAEWENANRNQRGPQPPDAYQHVMTDVTPEYLVKALSQHNRAMMLFYDEPEQLLSFDRYQSSGVQMMRGLLKSAYSGGPMKAGRTSRTNTIVEHGLAHVITNIQPRKLTKLDREELSDDGFLHRFVPVWFEDGIDADIAFRFDRFAYREMIQQIAQLHPHPMQIRNIELFDEIRLGILAHAANLEAETFAEAVGKAVELVVRLALIMQFADQYDMPHTKLEDEYLTRSERIVTEYVLPGQVSLLYHAGVSHSFSLAKNIAGYILTNPSLKTVSPGKLASSTFKSETTQTVTQALDLLDSWNWLEPTQSRRTSYVIDERVHTELAEYAEREITRRSAVRDMLARKFEARSGLFG